jgi:hypothetical protein
VRPQLKECWAWNLSVREGWQGCALHVIDLEQPPAALACPGFPVVDAASVKLGHDKNNEASNHTAVKVLIFKS